MVVRLWGIGAWTSLAWMKVKSGTAAPRSVPEHGASIGASRSAESRYE